LVGEKRPGIIAHAWANYLVKYTVKYLVYTCSSIYLTLPKNIQNEYTDTSNI